MALGTPRRSRWRALVLLAVLLGILPPALWCAWKWLPYLQEQRAIAALRAQDTDGKALSVSWSEPESRLETMFPMLGKPREFNILVIGRELDLRPVRSLRVVVTLDLIETTFGAANAEALTEVAHLDRLVMDEARVASEAWAHIGRLKKLRSLSMRDVNLGDEGLAQLGALPSLRGLGLVGCGVSDDGVAHLCGLVGLTSLSISRSRVTTAGTRHLKDLPQLKSLYLVSCGLTDDALEPLTLLPSLSTLDVSDNPITDKGLQTIARIKSLQHVSLNRTPITDEGITVFKGWPGRLVVEVKHTRVTEAGIRRVGNVFGTVGTGDLWFEHKE